MALPSIALAAIPSVLKGISGLKQARDGRRLAKSNVRPVYTRPVEVDQSLAIAEQGYYNGAMPGQDLLTNQIATNTAGASARLQEGASSSGDLLDGINKINYGNNQLLSEMQIKAAQWKLGQQDKLTGALSQSAAYSDQEFEYNQNQPYQDRAALASSLIGAGNHNAHSALGELSQIGLSTMGGKNPAGANTLPPPSFGKYTPSVALSSKMKYNPFTKQATFN